MVGEKWQQWKLKATVHIVFTIRKQKETNAATQLAFPVLCSLAYEVRLPAVTVGLPAAVVSLTFIILFMLLQETYLT